jgi:hypothetical protein
VSSLLCDFSRQDDVRRFAEEGGRRIVELATSPELSDTTGQYFEEGKPVQPAPRARDEAVARRLWQESARLTGLDAGASKVAAARA